MKHKSNTATIVNGDTNVEVELRNDGVIALQFSCKGSAIGLDVYEKAHNLLDTAAPLFAAYVRNCRKQAFTLRTPVNE